MVGLSLVASTYIVYLLNFANKLPDKQGFYKLSEKVSPFKSPKPKKLSRQFSTPWKTETAGRVSAKMSHKLIFVN